MVPALRDGALFHIVERLAGPAIEDEDQACLRSQGEGRDLRPQLSVAQNELR